MELTTKVRHDIYVEAARLYNNDTHNYAINSSDYIGLCHYMLLAMSIVDSVGKHYLKYNTRDLPEFRALQPNHYYGCYWFPVTKYGIAKRKQLLKQLVKDTEDETT